MSNNVPTPLQQAVRSRRRQTRVSQTELGLAVGRTQSAISMWENGRDDALAPDCVQEVTRILGISLEDYPSLDDSRSVREAVQLTLKYCSQAECLSQIRNRVGPTLILRPKFRYAQVSDQTICRECGEPLATRCQSPGCSIPVAEGAFCDCGQAYVDLTCVDRGDLLSWVAEQDSKASEIAQPSKPRSPGSRS